MGYLFDAIQKSSSQQPASAPVAADVDHAGIAAPAAPIHPAADEGPRLSLAGLMEQAAPIESPQLPSPPTFAPAASDKADIDPSQPRLRLALDKDVDDRLVAALKPSSLMAEEYRSIRTGILARWNHRSHLVHTITSATPQEGKTITSLNLGLSFAELHNRNTVVIEADLRLPQFGKLLNLPKGPGGPGGAGGPGLVGLLHGECGMEQAIHEVGPNRLHVIPAGRRIDNNAVQLLSGREMSALIKSLRSRYDHVIIDTPPVIELADAGILGAQSDDVLLIVRLNRTPKPLIEQAIRTLASYNAPVAGMLATDQQPHMRRYHSKYGYSYRYSRYAQAA